MLPGFPAVADANDVNLSIRDRASGPRAGQVLSREWEDGLLAGFRV